MSTTITAHQLVVGMKIRCPIEGDEITINDLVAGTGNFALGCDKGYTGFEYSDTFELVEAFDLTKCNLNWVNEALAERDLEKVGFGSQLTKEQEKSWEQWVKTNMPDHTPRFELIYNDLPIYIDMLTLLQCLKIAEHTHHIPPIDGTWWVNIIKQYPVEIHLDGRIQTQSE